MCLPYRLLHSNICRGTRARFGPNDDKNNNKKTTISTGGGGRGGGRGEGEGGGGGGGSNKTTKELMHDRMRRIGQGIKGE